MSALTLDDISGRILDADSHEFVPAGLWADVFGPVTAPFADLALRFHEPDALNSLSAPVEKDDAPISEDTLWQLGAYSPGAVDMSRRLEVMDALGVEQSLIFFTGVGAMGVLGVSASAKDFKHFMGVEMPDLGGMEFTDDVLLAAGRILIQAHNDWAIQTAKLSPRLRPVGVLEVQDLATAVADAERLISSGVRAINLISGIPPAGLSPGHPDLDPLWRVFAESNVPILLHGAGDFGFLKSPAWADYGMNNTFGKYKNLEVAFNPYSISQLNLGVQNYVTAMIFGGVFERFPTLRLGCIEVSAYWVGPATENMANVGRQFRRLTSHLSLTPAEYFERNIRVTPFWWEPIDQYIDRFGLEDVYVYGSDYPHFEGGCNPAKIFSGYLERLGSAVTEKFFVTNSRLLMA